MQKRNDGIGLYTVFYDPASYGYPYNTDSLLLAWWVCVYRRMVWCWSGYPSSARIVRNVDAEVK